MSEPELVLDFPAYAQLAKSLVLNGLTKMWLVPGVELIRRIETNYGSELGMLLKIGTVDCYRRSAARFLVEEAEQAADAWWENHVRRLWLEALLSPVRVNNQQAAVDFIAAAPPAIYWFNDTAFAYVPVDKYFRAFAADQGRLTALPTT